MKFFLRLSKDEVIELINLCMADSEAKGSWTSAGDRADEVLIYAEDERQNEDGERYAWVRGISNKSGFPSYFASFRINDFYMCYGDNLPYHYNEVLRAFMTRKFGEEYIKALYNQRLDEATLESKQLTEYLQIVRADGDSSRK